MMLKTY